MKELILHIGLAKTGTSTLQHYLTQNALRLADFGICYPKTGRRGVAHHGLAEVCRMPLTPHFPTLRKKLAAEMAPFDRAIISSEGFQSARCYPGVVLMFGFPTRKRPVIRTVCYLREFLETACSSYAQKVQNSNLATGLDAFCERRFRGLVMQRLSFWRWFSDDARFVLFDRGELQGADIVEDFFWQAEAKMPGPVSQTDANPSISGNLLGFKLLLNARKLHNQDYYRAFLALAREDAAYRGRFRLSDEAAAGLRARFSSYNASVGKLAGDVTCRSFDGEKPVFDPATWDADLERFLSHPALAEMREDASLMATLRDKAGIAAFTRKLGF
ncbi:hypothetical protein V6C03_10835 [Methyloligella sp. 2.7D]|uniref:hypothetical protein n=1 Tax=unclassified Methyloligella TaxID=2625955 RepID=UPI00157C6CD2|nr:hypothetical protein [Methyloligella sp. GL2]QKP77680.1 hypothetical protein HT051_09625 [Methyloligella sp. GL2]